MKIDNSKLYNYFTENGISNLYHANTVSTSITFLKQDGLMSRGAVEQTGLTQTPQSSDAIDKKENVWNDLFFDTIDLHGYFPRQNFYGPVLFEFGVDCILNTDYEIWITKNNPVNWLPETTNEERYFTSINEIEEQWGNFQRQRKMITIRNFFGNFPFDFVNRIIVDDPQVSINGLNLLNVAAIELKKASQGNLKVKNKFIKRSKCPSPCYCLLNYEVMSKSELLRLFTII